LRVPSGARVGTEELCYLAIAPQRLDWYGRPPGKLLAFNERTIDPIEPPDVEEDISESSDAMPLSRFADASHGAEGACEWRVFQPNDERGARKANIEGGLREVTVADPLVAGMCFAHQCSKRWDVLLAPTWLPDFIEGDDREVGYPTQVAGEGCLTTAGAAEKDDSFHVTAVSS
jgi:hypothetical protein